MRTRAMSVGVGNPTSGGIVVSSPSGALCFRSDGVCKDSPLAPASRSLSGGSHTHYPTRGARDGRRQVESQGWKTRRDKGASTTDEWTGRSEIDVFARKVVSASHAARRKSRRRNIYHSRRQEAAQQLRVDCKCLAPVT